MWRLIPCGGHSGSNTDMTSDKQLINKAINQTIEASFTNNQQSYRPQLYIELNFRLQIIHPPSSWRVCSRTDRSPAICTGFKWVQKPLVGYLIVMTGFFSFPTRIIIFFSAGLQVRTHFPLLSVFVPLAYCVIKYLLGSTVLGQRLWHTQHTTTFLVQRQWYAQHTTTFLVQT